MLPVGFLNSSYDIQHVYREQQIIIIDDFKCTQQAYSVLRSLFALSSIMNT